MSGIYQINYRYWRYGTSNRNGSNSDTIQRLNYFHRREIPNNEKLYPDTIKYERHVSEWVEHNHTEKGYHFFQSRTKTPIRKLFSYSPVEKGRFGLLTVFRL